MRKEFDDQEEFEEREEPDDIAGREVAFPATVRIAGIVWIVMGCLIIINALVSLGLSAAAVADNTANAGSICGAILPFLFGVAFIVVGRQTIRGTARDTLGNAIGSLVLGIGPLVCGFGAIAGSLAVANVPVNVQGKDVADLKANVGLLVVLGIVNILSGLGLMTAGALALIGRKDYRDWRRLQKDAKPREEA